MFVSGRTKKRGRGSAAPPTPSTLMARHKRPAKSFGSPSSSSRLSAERRTAALSIDPAEAGIVLDRLGKEVVSLLEAGGRKRHRVRRRLRMGINEVTKFLEATATPSGLNDSSSTTTSTSQNGGGGGGSGGGGGAGAIVIISGDVRPARLVEHLHALVALTGTPYLVLPGGTNSSSTLGRMFGCKTMAAFAICAAPTPAPTPPPPSSPPPPTNPPTSNTPTTATTTTTTTTTTPAADVALGIVGETPSVSMSGEGDSELASGVGGGIDVGRGGGGVGLGGGDGPQAGDKEEDGGRLGIVSGVVDDVVEGSSGPGLVAELMPAGSVSVSAAASGSCRELPDPQRDVERGVREEGGGGRGEEGGVGRPREGGGGGRGGGGGGGEPAVGDLAEVDEDVDSFVRFLRQKVRVPP